MKRSTIMEKALTEMKCTPCAGGTPPLQGEPLSALMGGLAGGWALVDGQRIEREFKFKDFRQALDFTVAVGEIAEKENHHPDISLGWGKVVVTLSTHKVHGLTENDFILAAKIDALGA
jgi:4a-hydroxytetrahydrobiopterin dehydratase